MMVDWLMETGGSRERGSEETTEKLTMKMLEDAFSKRDATVLPKAAFIAGRCQPEEPGLQDKLTELLRSLLDSLPIENLDIMAPAYIEAAMSLALRGDPDEARRALIPLVTDHASTMSRSYLAAFYLAQLGDPSGYPAMLAALSSKNEHIRLMAVRHLIGFKPYNGQTVEGKIVDIRSEMIKRLEDNSTYVRREVPYLLTEAGVDGLREILLPVTMDDVDPDVRKAARNVVEDLKNNYSIHSSAVC